MIQGVRLRQQSPGWGWDQGPEGDTFRGCGCLQGDTEHGGVPVVQDGQDSRATLPPVCLCTCWPAKGQAEVQGSLSSRHVGAPVLDLPSPAEGQAQARSMRQSCQALHSSAGHNACLCQGCRTQSESALRHGPDFAMECSALRSHRGRPRELAHDLLRGWGAVRCCGLGTQCQRNVTGA